MIAHEIHAFFLLQDERSLQFYEDQWFKNNMIMKIHERDKTTSKPLIFSCYFMSAVKACRCSFQRATRRDTACKTSELDNKYLQTRSISLQTDG